MLTYADVCSAALGSSVAGGAEEEEEVLRNDFGGRASVVHAATDPCLRTHLRRCAHFTCFTSEKFQQKKLKILTPDGDELSVLAFLVHKYKYWHLMGWDEGRHLAACAVELRGMQAEVAEVHNLLALLVQKRNY